MKKVIVLLTIICFINIAPLLSVSGQSIGAGISTSQDEIKSGITESGHSLQGFEKSIKNQESISDRKIWTPTDYTHKDIQSNTYTVQLGDTLWEIAEGYYGDANMWTHILSLNLSNIGFLSDGSQALIIEGQILNL